MIVIFLLGGLGNQMFQYALGCQLAKKYNTKVLFDTTFLNDRLPNGDITYYKFDLDIFGIVPRLTLFSKASEVMPIPGAWLYADLALAKTRNFFGIRKTLKELSPAFDAKVLDVGGNIFLIGYWQSEKYFKDIEKDIRATFTFKTPLAGVAKDIAQQIQSNHSVALHVRRGDYVTAANPRKLMGDTNTLYYERAIAYVADRVKDPHFFVFSNDIAWCRENIKVPFPATYLDDTSAGPKNIYHMQLMSLCQHNIIANSTFSWWAAWLNKNPRKIVVAPKQWFASAPIQPDLILQDWIAI